MRIAWRPRLPGVLLLAQATAAPSDHGRSFALSSALERLEAPPTTLTAHRP